jgi:hypothetical protein
MQLDDYVALNHQFCARCGRRFIDWYTSPAGQRYLHATSKTLGMPLGRLAFITDGVLWVHPVVVEFVLRTLAAHHHA